MSPLQHEAPRRRAHPAAWLTVALVAAAVVALAGCATVGPKIRVDYDRAADFSAYQTYGYPAELGTDRGGYYGYRYGLYAAWPLYASDVSTVHYKVGTANIDVVDARRKQLIWEGVAEGRLTQQAMENPETGISGVVTELFRRYPGRARASVPGEGGGQ